MTRQMTDSAFPLAAPPPGGWRDIVLIYAGGDTPHPWTIKDIDGMPSRYRWPCWVRSDPSQVNAETEAALFAAWLHGHQVPMGTCVILDIEEAINPGFVNAFNLAIRAAGFKTTKYGVQSTIWQNPKTDGGTFVALPGGNVLTTEGDTVARQYAFDGSFDLSITADQDVLPLWDAHPPAPAGPPYRHVTGDGDTIDSLAATRAMQPEAFWEMQVRLKSPLVAAVLGQEIKSGTTWLTEQP